MKKLSYSRLLADLNERDLQKPLQKLMIDNTVVGLSSAHPSSTKLGGVIYEQDEEHDGSPLVNKQKLPQIKRIMKHELT